MDATPTLLLHLPDGERAVALRSGEPISLGRDDGNAVRLDDAAVSRRHARLVWAEDGSCLIEDLQSANGTTLNGAPLARPEPLQDGDRLRFGEITAVYQVSEEDAARLPPIKPSSTTGEIFAARYRLDKSLIEISEYHHFLAADLSCGQQRTSLKIFHPGVIAQAGGFEKVAQMFARIRAAPPHPHLTRLLDFGRWRGVGYLVAEWIEGFPLLDLLRRRGALSAPDAIRLARPAAMAADEARARGFPIPDLEPRATLIAFDPPQTAADWQRLLDTPLERWPTFALKLASRPYATLASASASQSPLVVLMYELLGYPPLSAQGVAKPARIATLGELGNATLARGFTKTIETFGGDVAFVDALAQAAGVVVSIAPVAPVVPAASEPEPLPLVESPVRPDAVINTPVALPPGAAAALTTEGLPSELPPELLALTEQLAERIHDLWVAGRRREGWRHGAQRNDLTKEHPCVAPYHQIPESEKQRNRDTALDSLRAMLQWGYRILPPP